MGVGGWPRGDCRDFGRVHLYTPLGYDVPQECDRQHVELTFLRFDLQGVLKETLKVRLEMVDMFCLGHGKNWDV